MAKDLVSHLRYLGMIPQGGHREYGFRVEDKERGIRQVVLTIDDKVFLGRQLMFQEAPDLCYQKMLMDLGNETADTPIGNRVHVTASDVAYYRDCHPNAKQRNRPGSRRPQ